LQNVFIGIAPFPFHTNSELIKVKLVGSLSCAGIVTDASLTFGEVKM
jgi:hypothetical protein